MGKHVVYLTRYSGVLLPPFYIGSTTEKNALSGSYFGSVRSRRWSKLFSQELRENKHFFVLEILSHHEDRESALAEELRIQKLHNVVKSTSFMNESFAMINGYFGKETSGINSPSYGKSPSAETIVRMSNSHKGRNLSSDHRSKISRGMQDSEVKEKMRNSHLGNKNASGKRTPEQCKKMSEAKKRNHELRKQQAEQISNIF